MPIALTSSIVMPAIHGMASRTHPQLKIIEFGLSTEKSQLRMTVQYGNTVFGVWVGDASTDSGYVLEDSPAYRDVDGKEVAADPVYTNLIGSSKSTATDENLYARAKSILYQWLIVKGYYSGSIV